MKRMIFNFILGMIMSSFMVTSFMDKEIMYELWWIGIAFAIGISYFVLNHSIRRIEKLEEEIKELKNKN